MKECGVSQFIQTQSLTRSQHGRDVTCWEDVLPPVPDAPRRVYGKHCRLWSRRWRATSCWLHHCMPKEISGKPDAMVVQEIEVSAQTSPSTEGHRASGKPAALFSPKSNEQRNQMWSSVLGNANLSNLSGTLLEGNKITCWVRQDQI